jgi:hypothetical protein
MVEPASRIHPRPAARDLLLVAGTLALLGVAIARSDERESPAVSNPTPVQKHLVAETTMVAGDSDTMPAADASRLGTRDVTPHPDPVRPRRFDDRDFLLRTGWRPFDRRDGDGAHGDPSASFTSGRYGLAQASPPALRQTSQPSPPPTVPPGHVGQPASEPVS